MSHSVAIKLTQEMGKDIKYNRNMQTYIVYPGGIVCYTVKDIKEVCNYIEESEESLCVI